jgi:hypothetical protein
MPDPNGKGIYFVNGKSASVLIAYHVASKQATEIVSEEVTVPSISPNRKRVMYSVNGRELWVSDIDGTNKVKLASGDDMSTGQWANDNFHLTFFHNGVNAPAAAYIIGVDGSGLRELPRTENMLYNLLWDQDQRSIYLDGGDINSVSNVWKISVDGSNREKIITDCGNVSDLDPSGKYLLSFVPYGARAGIYEVSIPDKKCVSLLPGIATGAFFSRDGKSFLYVVASRGESKFYSQSWDKGHTIGSPHTVLTVPFAFPLLNSLDVSRDLSTIVFVRPGGHGALFPEPEIDLAKLIRIGISSTF